MKTEPTEGFYGVPIRRTRWPSFWIALTALAVSALLAAAFCGLLIWSSIGVGGTVIILLFGLLWGGIFFLSVPRQRRYARSLDLRRPGIGLAGGVLSVPLADDHTLRFRLDEPHELRYGWSEFVVTSVGGPTTHTRGFLTHATLSQAGRHLFLTAEDSVDDARAAGWPNSAGSPPSTPVVRLWAKDLVALVETLRAATASPPSSR